MPEEDKIRQIAREEFLKERLGQAQGAARGWYYHLIIYLVVNVASSVYVLVRGGLFFWPAYPIIFWGAGLVAHAIGVFGEKRRLAAKLQNLKESLK